MQIDGDSHKLTTVIDSLEKFVLDSSTHGRHVRLWARFIDDILCVWSGPDAELKMFLNELNSFDPAIKFTIEIGGDSINFIGSPQYSLYVLQGLQKTHFSGAPIYALSLHPIQQKLAMINSCIHWLIHLLLEPASIQEETNTIKRITSSN